MVFGKCRGCGNYLHRVSQTQWLWWMYLVSSLFWGKKKFKVRKTILRAPNKMSLKGGVLLWKKKEHTKTEAEYKTSQGGVRRACVSMPAGQKGLTVGHMVLPGWHHWGRRNAIYYSRLITDLAHFPARYVNTTKWQGELPEVALFY